MGTYGIGVGRTVAAAIEQSYDQQGDHLPNAHRSFPGSPPPRQYQNDIPEGDGRATLSNPFGKRG